jgi:hypothetical protein
VAWAIPRIGLKSSAVNTSPGSKCGCRILSWMAYGRAPAFGPQVPPEGEPSPLIITPYH